MVIFGEDDHFLARPSKEENLAVVPLMRKKHKALWNFAVEPKTGHGPGQKTWPLVFSFLRHTFAARVPADVWLQTGRMNVGQVVDYWLERVPFLDRNVARVAPGSGGVVFTPWLHGNRAPRRHRRRGSMSERTEKSWVKPVSDYAPIAVFFAAYLGGDLYVATAALMAATAAVSLTTPPGTTVPMT